MSLLPSSTVCIRLECWPSERETGPPVIPIGIEVEEDKRIENEKGEEENGENSLSLICNECAVEGRVTIKILEEVQDFFDEFLQPPINPIEDADNLIKAFDELGSATARVELNGFKAIVDVGLNLAAGDSFEMTLVKFPILGFSLPLLGDPIVEAGAIAALDFTFSADGEIDLSGGFEVSIPDAAFFEVDINKGEIKSKNLWVTKLAWILL